MQFCLFSHKKIAIPLLGCAVWLTATVAALSCGQPKAVLPVVGARDLILVTIDTLRADRVGIDGGPTDVSPAIDRLGRSGAVFLDATAHVPLTLPSHVSILSGRYPPSHGVRDNSGFTVPASLPTLASILHDAGFHTAAFVSSFVLRGTTGLSRGFDRYDDRFDGEGRSRVSLSSLERRGPETARQAALWLATDPSPFFLWVHFYDPHAPYDPPAAFSSRFAGRLYDGEVATSDFALSSLLEALSPERRARTVVAVTGDHGEALGDHGESEHGILLYDSTLHVPLVLQGAGVPAGVRIHRQARHVDLLPDPRGAGRRGGNAGSHRWREPGAADGSGRGFKWPGTGVRSYTRARCRVAHVVRAETRFGQLHFG